MDNEEKNTFFAKDAGFKLNLNETKWTVQIPKGGDFYVNYVRHINWWQRLWFRFIGWGVWPYSQKWEDQ